MRSTSGRDEGWNEQDVEHVEAVDDDRAGELFVEEEEEIQVPNDWDPTR